MLDEPTVRVFLVMTASSLSWPLALMLQTEGLLDPMVYLLFVFVGAQSNASYALSPYSAVLETAFLHIRGLIPNLTPCRLLQDPKNCSHSTKSSVVLCLSPPFLSHCLSLVISTPAPSTALSALGFSTETVTRDKEEA